jgi:hypothetical protein
MKARIGDEIIVDGPHQGDLARKGEVLEVRDVGGHDSASTRLANGYTYR